MSTETQNNALESAEPLVARDLLRRAKMVLQLVDKDKGSTICTGGLISDISTYLAAPIAAQPDPTQQDATLHAEVLDMVRMLEANEWADHCGQSELGKRLEWAITALQNQPQNIPEIIPESAKLDADKVQADLLNFLIEIVDAVIASDEEGLIEHSETIIKARAAIDAARKEAAHG